ncbi:phosphotransferase enzyme family protein [Micromonospora sp. CPCC 206061]|uniref:phosphotransferase enzyme family protein n=1 Tax=Micromonospora sp. CPCC 206061 TaxID=3122410 RepID=UPI002FF1D3F6
MTRTGTALERACRYVGIDYAGAEVIRAGENTLYLLKGDIVARVGRPGQVEAAQKEVRVSRWLNSVGVDVVEAIPDLDQPVVINDCAVTFWYRLAEHHEGSMAQVAQTLRRLHQLVPPPSLQLPPLAPFVRLRERIAEARVFQPSDRAWLEQHLQRLQERYEDLPPGLAPGAVHGDAWGGNIVATTTGPVVLDLERFSYGPPEWDLASIAVDHFTFGSLTEGEWATFCDHYGHDVTDWEGYGTLRDARELRKVTFAAQMADQHPRLRDQARYRLRCIQGQEGGRPWHWQPVP